MKTRAEYLTKRGWIKAQGSAPDWYDPINNRGTDTATAVTIQRARDAAEERAAWVAFAANLASMVGADGDGAAVPMLSAGSLAREADALLAQYRARFSAPYRFDDEVT